MNNKLEVIGIDHGWSMMKTVTQVFVTGVKEITTTPALFGDVLEYDGKYYKIGYLINGAWTEGIAFNDFMNRFNEVCAVPFANYYNSNTVNAVAIALCIYAMAIIMYYTSQRNYMPGKEYGTARFENPKQVNLGISGRLMEMK